MGRLRKQDIDTPALLVDLDGMESNLKQLAGFLRPTPCRLRPHFKNHRVLSLASRQLDAGAMGMTCARLGQAEALIHHGIKNILIANEIVGESSIKSLVDLSQRADVIVALDNEKVATDMARLSRNKNAQLNVLVDIDVGLKRCGVKTSEAALRLAKAAMEKGLRFRGLMGYEGHLQAMPPGAEKERVVKAAMQLFLDSKRLIEREGIQVETMSCGGTGTYSNVSGLPGVTEIQAGSYLLMDTAYIPFAPEFKLTLSVLVTVISKTLGERVVVDAGIKALSGERGMPSIKSMKGARLAALHAEHGIVEIQDPSVSLEVGDKTEIWVHYHDGTIHLHDRLYGMRDEEVEEVFKIER